ncbi:Endothelial cell-specific molecule 1 [Branchiostoma belcheri]|nr:Endothelial cell-specific molecule 1 [Branchiostoma belcheri]
MQTFKNLFSLVTFLALSNVACSTTPLYATVPENAAIGRNVTSVLTTSQMGEDDVQCEIVEGDEHGRFMITTCRITVARPLDYDVSPMYNLRVNVTRPVGKVEERRVDIQVQEVEGYPPIYNDTCAMPVLIGGKSGSLFSDVKSTVEVMVKDRGVFSTIITDSPQLGDSIFYHANSDCRLQFAATLRDKRDIASTKVLRGKCLRCASPDDAAVFELAVLNTDGSAECDFASDVGSKLDYLTTRLDIVGTFRLLKAPEASEMYNFKCNLPKLTLSLPVRNVGKLYEVTHFIRLESNAEAIGCPPNKYGVMCEKHCSCENGARCHGFNGACKCQPGWQGVVCDIPHSTVAIIPNPSDLRQIHIKGSLTLECRAFNLAVERMMWGFPNGTKTWLQRTQENQVRIESIRSEHNGTYTCTVVTEDKRVFLASYELQAVTCSPGRRVNCAKTTATVQ